MPALRLGTRGSALARRQTDAVAGALARRGVESAPLVVRTTGDRDATASLLVIGGQGVFVRQLEEALLDGRIDVAVHSAKDMPSDLLPGTTIAATLPRGDVRDALVGATLAGLAPGARVGTGSRRRVAQLLAARPDVAPLDIRGNVDTRLRKLADGQYDALILAAAGLERLGRAESVAELLPIDVMLPAPGQGVIALQIRDDNAHARAAVGQSRSRADRRRAARRAGAAAHAGGGLRRADRRAGAPAGRRGVAAGAGHRHHRPARDRGARVGPGERSGGRRPSRRRAAARPRRARLAARARVVSGPDGRAEGSGRVSLVGAGPGDPGLITVAGRERLRRADVVVYDRLAHPALVAEAPADAERIYVGKAPAEHAVTQDEIGRLLVDRARAGKRVVRLKGGDPFVFGRGGEEADDLVAAGVEFDVVPGITSAIAVPAYAGIPITHRDAASSFAVVTGHEAPGKPASRIDWAALATGVDTLVFLMGRRALAEIAARLIAEGRDPATPAAAIEWGATPRQRTVAAPLSELAAAAEAAALSPPTVIVVGHVVALRERLRWYDDRPLFGKRVLVTRTRAQAGKLSSALWEAGAEPIEFPAIEIVPRDLAPAVAAATRLAAGDYDWAVFTSANGVAAFWRAVGDAGLDARAFGGVRLAAIGPATVEALDAHGLRADVVPDRFVAEALADALAPEVAAGDHVLLPRAAGSRDMLPSRLRAAGARVDDLPVYESRRPARPDPAVVARIEAGEIDVASFTASSTVRGCLDLLDGRAELLRDAVIACIGPITAQTAAAAGLRVDVVAREHTIPGLVAALTEHAGRDPDHDLAHASAHV